MRDEKHKNVTLLEVTNVTTGKLIPAREAYVVVGSNVDYCSEAEEHLDDDRRPASERFDPCTPSVISFAKLEDARQFAVEHGGDLMPSDYAFAFKPDAAGGKQ